MVLSPWAVRELRFDESLGKLHGYDFDICMQARAAGKKVATAPFRAIHHHSLELISDPEAWIQTYIRLAEKWRDQLPDTGAEPEQRALRAEAEAACARALMVAHQMREQAAKRELDRVREELEAGQNRGTRRLGTAPLGARGRSREAAARTDSRPGQAAGRSTTRSRSSGASRSRAWRSAAGTGSTPSTRSRSRP